MRRIIICSASLKDFGGVAKLLRQLFHYRKVNLREVKESLEKKNVLVAKQGRRIVGLISFTLFLKTKLVYIRGLVVDKRLHNKGIGKRLLHKTNLMAKQRSCKLLFLLCRNERKPAHVFYLRSGFKRITLFTHFFYKRVTA